MGHGYGYAWVWVRVSVFQPMNPQLTHHFRAWVGSMLGSELEQLCQSARLRAPISHVARLHSDLSSMQCHAFFIIACILSSCHPGTCIPGNWHMPCFLSLKSHFCFTHSLVESDGIQGKWQSFPLLVHSSMLQHCNTFLFPPVLLSFLSIPLQLLQVQHPPFGSMLQLHFQAVVWLQSISIMLCYLCISISLLSHHSAYIALLYLYSFAPIMYKAPIIATCI